jgi:hypothetical protein
MRNKLFILGIFTALFLSCGIADKIPVAPFTHIPLAALWTTYYDRKIEYNTESDLLNIPKNIKVGSVLDTNNTENIEFNRISFKTEYVNRLPPIDLCLNIDLSNRNIKEIVFKDIKLIADETHNLLELPKENKIVSEYSSSYDGMSFSGYRYKKEFDNRLIIENDNINYIHGFTVRIVNIPFEYENNEEIKIVYEIIIEIKSETKYYIIEKTYKRKFLENDNSDSRKWNEITYEEWKDKLK